MAALNPEIIKDTARLINLYKNNLVFRERFDKAIKRNVNATYNYRPLKVYFEVLASTNSPKYKAAYYQVRKLGRYDSEGIIGKIFMSVTSKDILYLNETAKKAERKENATEYSDTEIEEINKIEEKEENIKNPAKKAEEHQKRVEYKIPEKLKEQTVEQKPEEKKEGIEAKTELEKEQPTHIVPGENPEHKKSFQPASQEEIARLKTALLPKEAMPAGRQEIPKNVLISPTGQALTKPFAVPEEPSVKVLVGPSGKPKISEMPLEIQQESEGQSSLPSISISNIPRPSGFKQFISNPRASINNFFRGGASAGKVVVRGTTQAIGKLGLNTAIKTGAGAAAKLGASAALGAATGGVSLIITLATSDLFKNLSKWILYITLGLILFIIAMFLFQRGEKMNSLLPPYDVPTMGPVGPVTPGTGGDISSCTFYRGGDTISGIKFNITEWPALINEVALQVGVPPAVLAGILRIERASAFAKTDPNYIKNDYDPEPYPYPPYSLPPYPVNPLQGYGVMQFLVSTFQGLNPKDAGKTSIKTDFLTPELDANGKLSPSSALRIYSIRDSLVAAALKVKADSGGGSWTDKDTIYKIAQAYYGCLRYSSDPKLSINEACVTGEHNYGKDLWNSVSNCQQISPTPTPSIGPIPIATLDQIVYWARIINGKLLPGLPDTSWNKMIADISNNGYSAHKRLALERVGGVERGIYWCTDIVIDAYNLAGVSGLSLSQEGVRSMQSFFQNTSGYTFIPYDRTINSLNKIKPGYTVIRIHPNNYQLDHASIVNEFHIDNNGDGGITTYDSNGSKSWSSPIHNGKITDEQYLAPIVGFGGII